MVRYADGNVADPRWMLHAADRALLGNKSGATRLGFVVLLKLFHTEGRFPHRSEEEPAAAWRDYDWHGRATRYHRVQIRTALGFREALIVHRLRPYGPW